MTVSSHRHTRTPQSFYCRHRTPSLWDKHTRWFEVGWKFINSSQCKINITKGIQFSEVTVEVEAVFSVAKFTAERLIRRLSERCLQNAPYSCWACRPPGLRTRHHHHPAPSRCHCRCLKRCWQNEASPAPTLNQSRSQTLQRDKAVRFILVCSAKQMLLTPLTLQMCD